MNLSIPLGQLIFLWLFCFSILYCAVRLAIKPLIKHDDSVITHDSKRGLSNLVTIDIISQSEYEELTDLYNKRAINEQNNKGYIENLKNLDDLKSLNYFTVEEYDLRLIELKAHFSIES